MRKIVALVCCALVSFSVFANSGNVNVETNSVYQGGWCFGIQDTILSAIPSEWNDEFTEWSGSLNVFDFSTNYQGVVPFNEKLSFTFLFGGLFSFSSDEQLKLKSIEDDWYYVSEPYHIYSKGDIVFSDTFDNSTVGLGLDLGLGFDVKFNNKFAGGLIYKPLVWRNWFRYDSYPLYYEVKAYFDFGKILENNRSAFRLELGWGGVYNGKRTSDFDGGFTLGFKCVLLGDSKSMRNKSALVANTVLLTLPVITEMAKNTTNVPDSFQCEECPKGCFKTRDISTPPRTYIVKGGKITYYRYECLWGHSGWYTFE